MYMHQTMRWFGPDDSVNLSDIRQAGCAGVVTALHHIPVGEVWTVPEIEKRKAIIEAAGMTWTVIESLPVSEDIKKRDGDYEKHIQNYIESLYNVAACGLKVITYNFMPVLDWVRTNIAYTLPNGSKALYFEKNAFAAFDLFLLKRPGAENEYSALEIAAAKQWLNNKSAEEIDILYKNALLGLPGSKEAFTTGQVLDALKTYSQIDKDKLKSNLVYFLQQVVPVAEILGLQLAIHPDDPPFPVLGLPRIVSTVDDIEFIINAVASKANGLCFCTGSLGARMDNDLLQVIDMYGEHIHFLHLRNTQHNTEGNFYEANHLEGSADMYAIVKKIVLLQHKLNKSIPMRPDHGHQMLDDLQKNTYPGYSAIGRLKGLAELRGLEMGIKKSIIAE